MRFSVIILFCLCVFAWAEWNSEDVHRLFIKRVNLKPGVYTGKLESVIDSAGLSVVYEYHRLLGDMYRPTVTSANDFGSHSRYSKHYLNLALDFRINDVPQNKRAILVENIRKSLGKRFLVLWESQGGKNEHVHVEFIRD